MGVLLFDKMKKGICIERDCSRPIDKKRNDYRCKECLDAHWDYEFSAIRRMLNQDKISMETDLNIDVSGIGDACLGSSFSEC